MLSYSNFIRQSQVFQGLETKTTRLAPGCVSDDIRFVERRCLTERPAPTARLTLLWLVGRELLRPGQHAQGLAFRREVLVLPDHACHQFLVADAEQPELHEAGVVHLATLHFVELLQQTEGRGSTTAVDAEEHEEDGVRAGADQRLPGRLLIVLRAVAVGEDEDQCRVTWFQIRHHLIDGR